jgi:hypothetical protein
MGPIKSLKSFVALNQPFRGLFCFQGLGAGLVSQLRNILAKPSRTAFHAPRALSAERQYLTHFLPLKGFVEGI